MESEKMMEGNQGYGTHPTIYGKLSNDELHAMYRGETWFQMDEHSRQQLLQETVNRAAAQKGELGACEVRFADLDQNTLGQQSGNVIEVNREVLAQDKRTHMYNGHLIEESVLDSNMVALETVLHEDIHAWQNQCIEGTIQCPDEKLLAEYQANDFTLSVVPDENGGVQVGSHYLNGVTPGTGYYMYYFQSTERDAHYYAERQAIQIMNSLEEKYGTERSFLEYQKGVLVNGYDATMQKGQAAFGNPNFAKEINQVLMNQHCGTNHPVDAKVEAAVQKEMAASYQKQMEGEINMSMDYKAVTMEDYDRTMRETVNSFYEHSQNDPTMSQEEVISQTGQVAENYLSTMEEVSAAQENGELAASDVAVETEGGVETGGIGDDSDGGIGDDDGGIGDD